MDYFTSSTVEMPTLGWVIFGVGLSLFGIPLMVFVLWYISKLCSKDDPFNRAGGRRRATSCHQCRRSDPEDGNHTRRHRNGTQREPYISLQRISWGVERLHCIHCNRRMRIWIENSRENASEMFTCEGVECPRRLVPQHSAPGNRFLCPLCNFNLCESCAESLVARKKVPSDKPPSYSILVNQGDLAKETQEAGLPTYEDAIKMFSEEDENIEHKENPKETVPSE